MAPLLMTILIEGSHGDYIHKRLEKIHYHPLIRKNFSDIHFAFLEKKVATRLKKGEGEIL